MASRYKRFGIFQLNQIIPHISLDPRLNKKISLNGYNVNVSSIRLRTYIKGVTCQQCGLTGQYFALEQHNHRHDTPHLNLYGINKKGKEIMMTSDHIIPKSRGGSNGIDNRQCLCEKCNSKKSDIIYKEYLKLDTYCPDDAIIKYLTLLSNKSKLKNDAILYNNVNGLVEVYINAHITRRLIFEGMEYRKFKAEVRNHE